MWGYVRLGEPLVCVLVERNKKCVQGAKWIFKFHVSIHQVASRLKDFKATAKKTALFLFLFFATPRACATSIQIQISNDWFGGSVFGTWCVFANFFNVFGIRLFYVLGNKSFIECNASHCQLGKYWKSLQFMRWSEKCPVTFLNQIINLNLCFP